MTQPTFAEYVRERFGGVLSKGSHQEDGGRACPLEAYSQWRGWEWTDSPVELDMFDLRGVADAGWSSEEAMTAAMVPVVDALALWRERWSLDMRTAYVQRVIIGVMRNLFGTSSILPDMMCRQCRSIETMDEAKEMLEQVTRILYRPPIGVGFMLMGQAIQELSRFRTIKATSLITEDIADIARIAQYRLGLVESDRLLTRFCSVLIECTKNVHHST